MNTQDTIQYDGLGVLVPIVTPCSRDGRIDKDGLRSVCDCVLQAGCNAIFAAGSTGRGPWFDRKDRMCICRTVAEYIGDGVPLFAGSMASGLSEMLENARAMADSGAHVAVITAPGYFSYSQKEIEAIFLRFADRSPIPVVVYDIPAFTGAKLDLEMVRRLAEHGNIIGFKDSSSDMCRFTELLNALGADSRFCLLQGKEHLLADSLVAGASGFVVSLVHVSPELFVSFYRAVRSGDASMAEKLQGKVTELMRVLNGCFERRAETSTMFHFLDQILRRKGVCENICLDFEGECPGWLAEEAVKALDVSAPTVLGSP